MTKTNNTRKRGAAILNILYEYTTPENGLSIGEVGEILLDEYGIPSEEKTLREWLSALVEMSEAGQLGRKVLKLQGEGNRVFWAAEAIFDESELRLLADGLTLSRINTKEMRSIVKKLQSLAGGSGRQIGYLKKLEFDERVDATFLWNICELSRAIQEKKPVSCSYTHWNTNGKLVVNRRPDGQPAVHVIDPYQLAYKNGRYYLICRLHGQGKNASLSHWRADLLRNVRVLEDSRVAPASEVLPGGASFDVLAHMDEAPYPFSGEAETVRVRTTSLDCIFDWFPKAEVTETDTIDDGAPVYEAEFEAILRPTCWWALQYAGCVEVLEPPALREMITESVDGLIKKYH